MGYYYIALVSLLALAALAVLPLLLLTGKGTIIVAKLFTKLGIPLLPFLYAILRSLWMRFEPPSGIPLNSKQAPQLFGLIDRLRREIKAPYIHQVLIDDELNACVTQIPRLGLFGWYKSFIFKKFFDWFAPRFGAYSFVIARIFNIEELLKHES